MSKDLEMLKDLYNGNLTKEYKLQCYKDIEKELKEYELMKNTKIIVSDKKISDEDLEKLINQRVFVGSLEQREVKPLFDEETQKKLKALEIIKDKRVNVSLLSCSEWLDFYNQEIAYKEKELTQEEFDLLKEVLL